MRHLDPVRRAQPVTKGRVAEPIAEAVAGVLGVEAIRASWVARGGVGPGVVVKVARVPGLHRGTGDVRVGRRLPGVDKGLRVEGRGQPAVRVVFT